MQKNIWICIEKADENYSAYAPEVLGCVSAGYTVEETRENMIEALQGHVEGMLEDGESLNGITGAFPVGDAVERKRSGDLWALVEIDVEEKVMSHG
jgi:predicted RNase H-like HicB family nuclease